MKASEKKILTIMQTRCGSSRLPGKVVKPILDRPLFVRQAERIRASALYGQLLVATSGEPGDDLIAELCPQYGLDCFRGHATDLLDRHYRAAVLYRAEIVVKIPSDCPLIDPAVIDRVIRYYLDNETAFDYVSNLHPASYPDGNDVEVMSFAALENAWKNARKDFEREHATPYLWERPEVFRIGNVLMEAVEGEAADLSMSHRFTIDYEADYFFIKKVYEELYPANPLFGLKDILDLLRRDPAIYALNRHLAGVNWYRHHLGELTTISNTQTRNHE